MSRGIHLTLLALLFATLLVFRIELLVHQEAGETLKNFIGTSTVLVVGTIADDPDQRDKSLRVTLDVQTVGSSTAVGRMVVSLPPATHLQYGDTITAKGKIEAPANFETENGREFDYVDYLRVRGVVATMSFAKLATSTQGGASVLSTLFDIKHKFEQSLESVIPKPQVGLLEGILLGERGGLSSALLQLFVVVGLIHVVVLSGSNISVVGEAVLRSLGFAPRGARYVLGGVVILLFVLMTGSGAAAVRALIMGGIGLVARYLRRPQLALRSLGVAVAAMLLYNPLFVLDSGFMLSVLATFGLITLSPWVESKLMWVPAWEQFNMRSIAASSLSVEIFLLPALLYYTGNFSIAAFPVNLLVLPFVPLVMLAGFVAGMVALASTTLALVPALISSWLLGVMIWVTQTGASLPFASTTIAAFPLWLAILFYIPLIWAASYLVRQSAFLSRPNSSS